MKLYFISYVDNKKDLENQGARVEKLLDSACNSGGVFAYDDLMIVFIGSPTSLPFFIEPRRCHYKKSLKAAFIPETELKKMLKKEREKVKIFILGKEESNSVSEEEEDRVDSDMRNLSLCTDIRNEFPDIYMVVEVINPAYYDVFDYIADEVVCAKIVTDKIVPNALLTRDYPAVVKNLISLNTRPSIFTIEVDENSNTKGLIGLKYGIVKDGLLRGNPSVNLIGILISQKGLMPGEKEMAIEINPISNTQLARWEKVKRVFNHIIRKILLIENGNIENRQISVNYRFRNGDFMIVIACEYKGINDAIVRFINQLNQGA